MPLAISHIHPTPADAPTALNSEWLILENQGTTPFSAKGCTLSVSRGSGRPREIGKLDPGFALAPGQSIRLVTGSPGSKAHGQPPAEESGGPVNYYLLLKRPLVQGPGTTIHLNLRQLELCKATYASESAPAAAPALAAARKKGA